MPAIDHDMLRWVRTTGRIAAGRATLWALAQSGDLLSRFLQPGPRFRVRDLRNRPADFDPLTSAPSGPQPESFLGQDPPDHTRLRRLAAPAFRPKLILFGGLRAAVNLNHADNSRWKNSR